MTILSQTDVWLLGKHSCLSAIENNARKIKQIFLTVNTFKKHKHLFKKHENILKILNDHTFKQTIPQIDIPNQGIAIIASKLPNVDLTSFIKKEAEKKESFIILLDHVYNPQNLGAIIRSSVALNVGALITPTLQSPKETTIAASSSAGTIEKLPIIKVTNIVSTLKYLKQNNYWVIGLSNNVNTQLESIPNYEKKVLIIGSENKGMKELTTKNCDIIAKININPHVESLNASVAAALATYILQSK